MDELDAVALLLLVRLVCGAEPWEEPGIDQRQRLLMRCILIDAADLRLHQPFVRAERLPEQLVVKRNIGHRDTPVMGGIRTLASEYPAPVTSERTSVIRAGRQRRRARRRAPDPRAPRI